PAKHVDKPVGTLAVGFVPFQLVADRRMMPEVRFIPLLVFHRYLVFHGHQVITPQEGVGIGDRSRSRTPRPIASSTERLGSPKDPLRWPPAYNGWRRRPSPAK